MPDVNVYHPDTQAWTTQPPSGPGGGLPNGLPIPHPNPTNASRDNKVDRLWATQARLSNFGTIYNAVESQFPTFTHSISVSVTGGPKSDMRRIWLLCLSTAFGRYRQGARTGIQTGQLQATWDITGKACQVVISYVNSGVEGALSGIKGGGPLAAGATGLPGVEGALAKFYASALESPTVGDFLFAGPSQETVGGDTLSWLNADGVVAAMAIGAVGGGGVGFVVGGAADILTQGASSQVGLTPQRYSLFGAATGAVLSNIVAQVTSRLKNRPKLPDTNRLITTANKLNPNVQPPAPSGDGLSRTFPWVSLVANALTAPCYQPALPPKSTPVPYTPTMYSPPPQTVSLNGNKVPNYTDNQPVDTDVNVQEVLRTIEGIMARKDGYVQPLEGKVPTLSGPVNQGDN